MQLSKIPTFRAHLGRHGHNLSHDFSFTSGTGHLLTVFDEILYPKDTIRGKIDMFTRTQPLLNPANVEIDEYIDYFFVPLDMLYSGFGDFLFQVNEPYSNFIKKLNDLSGASLPVAGFEGILSGVGYYDGTEISTSPDYYAKDLKFLSVYRNMFHNGLNPNYMLRVWLENEFEDGVNTYVHPVDMFQPNILPLTLMAYNCVYEHFYRLDDREVFLPQLYNIDSYVFNQDPLWNDGDGDNERFLSLKYRPLNFDYFTSISPKPFFAGASNVINGGELANINNYMDSHGIKFAKPSGDDTGVGIATNDFTQLGVSTTSQMINTGSLRSMFAVEKLLQITSRTKKTYDAQVLAHLGVEVPHDVLHEIIHVGTQHSMIRVGEVVSTAGTSDTPLGDIAGKGYGSMSDKPINFTAPCHGIFIGIYSAVPKFRYYAPLEKRRMIDSRLAFHIPEYEKLGQQPVFGYEAFAYDDFANQLLGWQMRYEQYKRRFNKVSPSFIDTVVNYSVDPVTGQMSESFNMWHNWVLSRRPLNYINIASVSMPQLNAFLCGPDELNGLMALDYGTISYWNTLHDENVDFFGFDSISSIHGDSDKKSFAWNMAQFFYRDPLLHFAKCDFKVINKMQDNTLPDFID